MGKMGEEGKQKNERNMPQNQKRKEEMGGDE